MAGKKKKPAANPNRGFATTSIASKPKPQQDPSDSPASKSGTADTATPASAKGSATPAQGAASEVKIDSSVAAPREKQLHELSPEELEKRLEEAELQSLVEKYSEKTRRDASRHVSKLQTECRLLRSTALQVSGRGLLTEQLVDEILALASQDVDAGRFSSTNDPEKQSIKEEDAIVRLWTLRRALESLGFQVSDILSALKFILRFPPPLDTDNLVWGLSETLDWLVLNSSRKDVPIYDAATGKPKVEFIPDSSSAIDQVEEQSDGQPGARLGPTKAINGQATQSSAEAIVENDDDIEVSDVDSDLEPDEIMASWLSSRAKLYELRPDLFESEGTSKAKKKNQNSLAKPRPITAGVRKLQQKLTRIESDVLFDRYEAEDKWILKRNQIAQEVADKRRNEYENGKVETSENAELKAASTPNGFASEATSTAANIAAGESDDEAIGGLFGESLAQAEAEAAEQSEKIIADTQGVTMRMFETSKGKGLTPKRVLEEACKARDPNARLTTKLISIADWSNRHALTVNWSKSQPLEFALEVPGTIAEAQSKRFSFTMDKVSCPDASQSEGYVCTLALFQIFSTSMKEEKVNLRLPPIWRELWQEFSEARKSNAENQERQIVAELRSLVQSQLQEDEDEDVIHTKNFEGRQDRSNNKVFKATSKENGGADSSDGERLRQMWHEKSSAPSYQSMLRERQKLPMAQFREQAVQTVRDHQITILCGETGCGKSTQMPAFILEDQLSAGKLCKIYCTEPRRISAITLAQRVSQELGEARNAVGTSKSLVGYAIRLESHISGSTRLVYATTGIVLRMLESPDGFAEVTHIVIDEVHERSIETDFLLIILRKLLLQRPTLKIILMSATVDAQKFANYFQGAPVLNVPGRTFPVETKFLEDAIEVTNYKSQDDQNTTDADDLDDLENLNTSDKAKEQSELLAGYSKATQLTLSKWNEYRIDYGLISKLITTIATSELYMAYKKAILVFLPGLAEIRQLSSILYSTPLAKTYDIHTLHSSIASEDQQAAFLLPAHGRGKIVLSTNIAETGVTIPDITSVIDTGKHKEMRFDERRQVSRLLESFISRANAKQRRGRAGRVQNGLCFHLFSQYRHDRLMSDQQTPEMLRLSLQDLVMRVKVTRLGDIQTALSAALDAPAPKNIKRAIDQLIEVGALTATEELTTLGQQLSKLPLDPYLGKLVLYGSIFSTLDPALSIAAILTSKSPFVAPMDAKKLLDQARVAFKKGDSDLLTEYNAYLAWKRTLTDSPSAEYAFCRKNCLSPQTLSNIEDLKGQLYSALVSNNLIPDTGGSAQATTVQISRARRFLSIPQALNTHGNPNSPLLAAVLSWSLYPKIIARDPAVKNSYRAIGTQQAISLHPTSIARLAPPPSSTVLTLISYYAVMQSTSGNKNYYANGTTPVHPLLLLLGPAGDARFEGVSGAVILDGARLRAVLGDGSVSGWRMHIAVKFLRWRVIECVERRWKGRGLGRGEKWWVIWEKLVESWEENLKLEV